MSSRFSRNTLFIMIAILLVAAILRLPLLTAAPPGLHYDEAANGILAAEIGFSGKRPIFIPSYTGKEVLFFYLAGGLMQLIGNTTFSLRLTAAFVGLLTVATTYWLGRELKLSQSTAIFAAMLLTISFWHVLFSRLGFRAIVQPLLQALTVVALLRGLKTKEQKWWLLSGFFLGLTAYTYLAARLFPILLGIVLLPVLVRHRQSKQFWLSFGGWLLVAFVVLVPLLGYFWVNPDTFWVRITQVAPSEETSVFASYLKSLGMFFWLGDPYIRFNIPQRPLFNPLWGFFLVVGWSLTLTRWSKEARQQMAVLLLLLTPFLMILPTALATGEITPSNLRAIGLIPFIFYLPAIGLDWLLSGLMKLSPRLPATAISLLLILLLGMAVTGYDYFRVWATDQRLFYESDGDLTAVSTYLDNTDLSNKQIYVAALHYQHPTVAFLSETYDQINWLPNSSALPLPQMGNALYIYPYNSPAPAWVKALLPSPTVETADFTVYQLAAAPNLNIPNPTLVNLGNVVTLIGSETASGKAGETLSLTLYWQIDGIPPADVKAFIHLEDQWEYRWSQTEPFAYPVAQWKPGDLFVQQVNVPVPVGTPPGAYQLRVGMFAPDTGDRLVRLDEQGRYAGNAFVIQGVGIEAGELPSELPTPPVVSQVQVLPELTLLGYERGKTAVTTGERLDVALWWQATAPLPALTTRLELVRADNTGRILLNTQPVNGTYPFTNWITPQLVVDRISEPIPDSFQTGDYRLQVRMLDAAENSLITADLGSLSLTQANRLFTPPKTMYPLDAAFGNEIRLRGYDLETTANDHELSLVWQAAAEPAANYTVFVHILNLDDSCCVWQQDVQPQQGQYPTTRWVGEEVVIDSYTFTLPADLAQGNYNIEVGLYIAETGQRLQVIEPGQAARDVVYLRPLSLP